MNDQQLAAIRAAAVAAQNLAAAASALVAFIDEANNVVTYFDVPAYADRIGVSQSTVRRQLLAGQIPGAEKVGSQWRIRVEASA